MKTIEEAAKEDWLKVIPNSGVNLFFSIGYEKGVEFAQLWIPVEIELPIPIEYGDFDGMRSEFVLAKLSNGNWHKARTYSGIIDGSEFCDWGDENDFVLRNVVSWRPTELK